MKNLFNLPNILTLCNLICGCFAILSLFSHGFVQFPETIFFTPYFLLLAASVFDFFDGFAARWLQINSPIGKQLDSLADVVTFGVAPSMIMYFYLQHLQFAYSEIAFLIVVCSALRLAKFNVDERQTEGFLGLPTPANALFFGSLVCFSASKDGLLNGTFIAESLHNPWVVVSLIVVFCYLMISEIPIFSLKFKSYGWKGNQYQYILLSISVTILILMPLQAMPFLIVLYVALSVIKTFIGSRKITKN